MIEAMRLTRAGRLADATTLLQRLLRDEGPDPSSGPAHGEDLPVVDLQPVTVGATDAKALAGPPQSEPRADQASGAFASLPSAWQGRAPGAIRMGLGETLRRLAARVVPADGEPWTGPSPTPGPAPLPDGAAFVTASFTNQAGTRSYKLYLPSGRAGQRLPLVVMLHGCTQSPDDFAAGTRMNALAEEHGCLVAYPAQPAAANPSKCWNWFEPNDQQRGQGEPSLIAGITRQIIRDHSVDPSRVYVAGLSAGGAAAAILGATYSDLYAAIGVHSGLACGAASDLPSAFRAMRQGGAPVERRAGRVSTNGGAARIVPTIVMHGDQDTTVHPRNGDEVIAQSKAAAIELRAIVQHGQVPGGHAYRRAVYSDPAGRPLLEQWTIHGAGHAWAGGSPAGSYTDPRGPDAAREMLRFFLEHSHPVAGQPV
ncbi:MAG TPA: PHB depolymerase family esterase [Geminicoccaceae bacterium]|nr:PHB depolymerase family esterase [Geminicoccaceae bacterium]